MYIRKEREEKRRTLTTYYYSCRRHLYASVSSILFLTAFKVSHMKVSERVRQSSIIDLYIRICICVRVKMTCSLTDT